MTATKTTAKRAPSRSNHKTADTPKLSHRRSPADLTVAEWQRRLRRQFGREQSFGMGNIGDEPVFSEFLITNPASGGSYRADASPKSLNQLPARVDNTVFVPMTRRPIRSQRME